ncbi:MAG: hypothetical protein A2475_01050 [Ignavibacteria bacterium RIFOXYC2_FULL_35_21]|nr:MAG: hypothetical protein A2220_03840 [Ignavibacteria bacterium RIFOXYA2_FULL_35_10]OGV24807.1 MAG: hypothetical protein A2475_01050 [Ignavibacteria bacterium RIFOXYC2_FULL_35_21]
MESLYITVKDSSKKRFLIDLLNKLDFVKINGKTKKRKNGKHDIFMSAGMWKNRSIDADELRKQAWKLK